MSIDNTEKTEGKDVYYNIDRKTAAKKLKVSIRTVDRYIKKGDLSTMEVGGMKMIDIRDLKALIVLRDSRHYVEPLSTVESIDIDVDKVDTTSEILSTLSTSVKKKNSLSAFKNLYLETKKELAEKQQRLELANYRVGQLEAQLRNSIPLLQYFQENESQKKLQLESRKEIAERESSIKKLNFQIKKEVFIKRFFLILLLILIAFQPLWLLLFFQE